MLIQTNTKGTNMSQKIVNNIMNKNPINVICDTPLMDIIKVLINSQQTQIPVLNNNKDLIGMVSLIDCQKALLISGYHCDMPVTVDEVMTKDFVTIPATDELSEVAIKTQKLPDNIFPVVSEGKLVGILKRIDLLVHLQNNLLLCS